MSCLVTDILPLAYTAGYGKLSWRLLKECLVASACHRAGSSCTLATIMNSMASSGYAKLSTKDIAMCDVAAACAGVGGGGNCSAAQLLTLATTTDKITKMSEHDVELAKIAVSC